MILMMFHFRVNLMKPPKIINNVEWCRWSFDDGNDSDRGSLNVSLELELKFTN